METGGEIPWSSHRSQSMTRTYETDRVSLAYMASPVAVYGRYRDRGYQARPITDQLGTMVPDNVSATEAFRLAGLDWTADKRPLTYMGQDGPVESRDHIAIVRSDNDGLLGIHGTGYTPVQHTAMINLLDYLREDIKIESVLSIRDGKKMFATANINTEGEVVPGDTVRRYLHLFNSHDGSSGFGVFFSDVRLACANQLAYLTGKACGSAVDSGAGLRRKHTASVSEFARSLPQLINLERRTFAQSLEEMRSLASVNLTPEIARRVLESTYADRLATPVTDRHTGQKRARTIADLSEVETIRSHYSGSTGYGTKMEGVTGTLYALFNSITQYETHDAGRSRNETDRARARLESLWGGASAKRIDRAREACLALV